MPKIPGGQTGAPTVMIAEKAADIIIQSAYTVERSVAQPFVETGTGFIAAEVLSAPEPVIQGA